MDDFLTDIGLYDDPTTGVELYDEYVEDFIEEKVVEEEKRESHKEEERKEEERKEEEHKEETDAYSKIQDDEIVYEDEHEIYTKRDFGLLDHKEQLRVTRLKIAQVEGDDKEGSGAIGGGLGSKDIRAYTSSYTNNSMVSSTGVGGGIDTGSGDNGTWGDKNLTKETKIERTAAIIAARSDAITMPNAFGELDTYIARRQQKDGAVVYWEQAYRTELEHMVYASMLSQDVIGMAKCRLPATASNARAVTDTVLHATYTNHISDMAGTVMLSSQLIDGAGCEMPAMYYDIDKGEIMPFDELEDDKRGKCFRRFCNTTSGVLHVPIIPESEIRLDLVLEHAKLAKKEMAAHYKVLKDGPAGSSLVGIYNMRFETSFGRWACGDIGLYVDILTMCATPLMRRKPECTFFILGRAANGKSSLRHLLQTIYGVRNCADVQVSQMGSWDYAATLLGKMVNFPDEEKSSIEDMDKAAFKSMSTHENIHIRKKGSSVPFDIKCDFISIVPLNELPNWKNLDSGVARRIKILPFNADLSKESVAGGVGFEEATYTPEFVSRVIGELIGIASFYSSTGLPIIWSGTTERVSTDWKDAFDNTRLFKRDFDKVFSGFTSLTLLYECYQRWCKGGYGDIDVGIDYPYDTKKRVSETFRQFGGYSRRASVWVDGKTVSCTCDSRKPVAHNILAESTLIDVGAASGKRAGHHFKTVRECLDMGTDPVTIKLASLGGRREDDTVERKMPYERE